MRRLFHFVSFYSLRGGLSSGVSNDFAEAPSQMLENWVWEPKVLKKISSHYQTEEPLPDELIDKLIQRFVPFHNVYLTVGRIC